MHLQILMYRVSKFSKLLWTIWCCQELSFVLRCLLLCCTSALILLPFPFHLSLKHASFHFFFSSVFCLCILSFLLSSNFISSVWIFPLLKKAVCTWVPANPQLPACKLTLPTRKICFKLYLDSGNVFLQKLLCLINLYCILQINLFIFRSEEEKRFIISMQIDLWSTKMYKTKVSFSINCCISTGNTEH